MLLAGGGAPVEVYGPASSTFAVAAGGVDTARFYATGTPLADGRVLIVGGYDTAIVATASAWLYQP